jgi:O-antigen/teichoic acid export membrane protein
MVLGYFSIFDLGLSRATVKFVAEHLSPDKISKVPELVWTSLFLLISLGCVFGIVAAALVPFAVTSFFKMPASFVGDARTSLLVLCLSMPIMLATDALRGVLEAAQRFDLVNSVKVPASVAFYLLAALAIPLGIRVPGVVSLLVFVRLTSALIYLFLCFRIFPGLKTNIHVSRAALRPLSVFGGWIMVSNITGPIFGYLERFMIASIISLGMLTYYSVPFDLVGKILILPMSIVPSLFPYFSYHGSRSTSEVSEVTSRVMKYLLLLMAPVIAVSTFFAREILTLWMGSEFAVQGTIVLQIVSLLFFLNGFAMIPFTSVQALGRPDLKAILDIIVLPTYAIGAWWLMRRMGINGAALAKLSITVIDCTVLYVFASRLRAFSPRDLISGPFSRALVVTGGLFAAVFLVESLHAKLIVSVALLVLCFACYAALFWVTAVDDRDRSVLRAFYERTFSVLRRPQPKVAISGE